MTALGAYRFDDPAGEVGVETFLLQAGDVVLQVPLTYRSGPLPGAEDALVGETEHSVLGRRWVHDGTADPVWLAAARRGRAHRRHRGGRGDGGRRPQAAARPQRDRAGQRRSPARRCPTWSGASVRDDGPTTVVEAGEVEVVLARVVGTPLGDGQTLTGGPAGHEPSVLAVVRTG